MKTYIHDNRDGTRERVFVRRHIVADENKEAWRRAVEDTKRRNQNEGWDRFVPIREKESR